MQVQNPVFNLLWCDHNIHDAPKTLDVCSKPSKEKIQYIQHDLPCVCYRWSRLMTSHRNQYCKRVIHVKMKWLQCFSQSAHLCCSNKVPEAG